MPCGYCRPSAFGSDVAAHPYTTGWQPNYVTEAKIYANYLKENKPNAKVAVGSYCA